MSELQSYHQSYIRSSEFSCQPTIPFSPQPGGKYHETSVRGMLGFFFDMNFIFKLEANGSVFFFFLCNRMIFRRRKMKDKRNLLVR